MKTKTPQKIRGDSRLHRLPHAVQEALLEQRKRLSLRDCLKWLKAEHQVTISCERLRCWFKRREEVGDMREVLDGIVSAKDSADMVKEELGGNANIPKATVDVLGQRVFETLLKKDLNLMERLAALFVLLSKTELKKERVEIEREYLDLAREDSRFKKTQRAMIHGPKIKTIAANSGLSSPEKIQKVRKLLFGEEAT